MLSRANGQVEQYIASFCVETGISSYLKTHDPKHELDWLFPARAVLFAFSDD